MAVDIDDKKLDGKGLSDLWGIIKQYVAQHGSGVVPATEDTLGGIMVGSTLSITNAGVLNLPTLVTASTFRSVSVDAYGRVVGGTNPTTLAAYGITDAKIENGVITLGGNTITPITSLSGYATQSWVQQQGYTTNIGTVTQVKIGSTAYNPSSGVISLPAYPTVPTKVSELTNDSGYTTNIGTVTQVKVGSTAYNPSSGVVSLPAYETGAQKHIAPTAAEVKSALGTGSGTSKYLREDGTWQTPPDNNTWRPLGTGANDACAGNDSRLSNARPASDVYSWAKASSKPSYTLDEVSDGSSRKLANYLPLSGGTLTSSSLGVLTLNSTYATETGLEIKRNGTTKAWFGYQDGSGTYMFNNARGKYLTYGDNGVLLFEGQTVYHSGNLPAYPTKSSWNYDDRYLSLSGGTITSTTINVVNFNSSAGYETGITFQRGGNIKAWMGYMDGGFVYMFNAQRGNYLKYHDNGTLTFENQTVIHTGHITIQRGTMNHTVANGSHLYYLSMSVSDARKCIFSYIMENAYQYQSGCYTYHAGNGLADTMGVKYVNDDTYNGTRITYSWLVTTGSFDAGNVYYSYIIIN